MRFNCAPVLLLAALTSLAARADDTLRDFVPQLLGAEYTLIDQH